MVSAFFSTTWRGHVWLASVAMAVLWVGCSGSRPSGPYRYEYKEGKTARITADGYAVAPGRAPKAVKRAIEAGNEICRKPYRRGGGHGRLHDTGYDCSGSTCYVLNKAGLMRGTMPSGPFRKYGRRGEGDWISVYSKNGHVFLVVAGLRFDTSTNGNGHVGPRWQTKSRSTKQFTVRHPPGL
ncbi:MAG: peptidoglycan endopeptidase [Verrucomicrobiales bacterium]